MNYKSNEVKQLYTLRGSFPLPVGEVEKTENGFLYKGDGYEVATTVER